MDKNKHANASNKESISTVGGPILPLIAPFVIAWLPEMKNFVFKGSIESYGQKFKGANINAVHKNSMNEIEPLDTINDELVDTVEDTLFDLLPSVLDLFDEETLIKPGTLDLRYSTGTNVRSVLKDTGKPAISIFCIFNQLLPSLLDIIDTTDESSTDIVSNYNDDDDDDEFDVLDIDGKPVYIDKTFENTTKMQSLFAGSNEIINYYPGMLLPKGLCCNWHTQSKRKYVQLNESLQKLFEDDEDNLFADSLRIQLYDVCSRNAFGEMNKFDKLSYKILNMQAYVASNLDGESFTTNINRAENDFNSFCDEAYKTFNNYIEKPVSRAEVLFRHNIKDKFTKKEFMTSLKKGLKFIRSIYELDLIKGYDAETYVDCMKFYLEGIRGLVESMLPLSQLELHKVSTQEEAFAEFTEMLSFMRSILLRLWNGRVDSKYGWADPLTRLAGRLLVPSVEIFPNLLAALKKAGATDELTMDLMQNMGINLKNSNTLSSNMRKHAKDLRSPDYSNIAKESAYYPPLSTALSRICINCFQAFQSVSNEEFTLPPTFVDHPCYLQPDQKHLLKFDSTEVQTLYDEKVSGLEGFQVDIYNAAVKNRMSLIIVGGGGTGKTKVTTVIMLKYLLDYGYESVIALANYWNTANNFGGKTINSVFKWGLLDFNTVYKYIHQLEDESLNREHVETFIAQKFSEPQSRRVFVHCKLLVIDECFDTLSVDKMCWISIFFSIMRNNPEPFGGIQFIFPGDPAQVFFDQRLMKKYQDFVSEKKWVNHFFGKNFKYFYTSRKMLTLNFTWAVFRNSQNFRLQGNHWWIECSNRARFGQNNEEGMTILTNLKLS